MSAVQPIPQELVDSPIFKNHTEKLVKLDEGSLQKLRDNLPSRPEQLKNKEFVAMALENTGLSEVDYLDVAPVARMFSTGLALDSYSYDDLIEAIVSQLGIDLTAEQISGFRSFISPTEDEILDVDEASAFSYGDTFGSLAFKPLISPSEEDGALHFGGNLEIGYIDASGQKRVLALSVSAREIEKVISFLQMKLNVIEKIKVSVAGSKK